jgi:regulator of sigma E protease
MVIVSAGVIMNVILAAIIYMIVFMIGFDAQSPDIGLVIPDSPADMAGLRTGDHVESIDGSEVDEFLDILMAIVLAEPYEPLHFKVLRDGHMVDAAVIPELSEEQGKLNVGISGGFTSRIGMVANSVHVPDKPRLQPEDTIIKAGDATVGPNEFYRVWQALLRADGLPVKLTVERPANPGGPPEMKEVYVRAPLALLPQVAKDFDTETVLGLAPRRRIFVVDEGTPGEKAGLREDDVILEWDGRENPTHVEITDAIRDASGREIHLGVLRDGKEVDITVAPKKVGLWWRKRELKVGVSFEAIEETAVQRGDHRGLVVARVLDAVQGQATPASTLMHPSADPSDEPIKRGALLISADDTPLDSWRTLIHHFERRSYET